MVPSDRDLIHAPEPAEHAPAGPSWCAVRAATAGIAHVFAALRDWLRGATGAQAYESYLRHAREHSRKPLTAGEFYVESARRKYSRPHRCC